MLDRLLPDYLKIPQTIEGVTYDPSTLVSGRIFRCRAPQSAATPYVYVADSRDIDHGATSRGFLSREIGTFNVFVCGTPELGYHSLDPICDAVVELLKACRQRYIPSNSVSYKMWVQCILPLDREQFEVKPLDGNERPYIGYCIPIRAGYDKPIRT